MDERKLKEACFRRLTALKNERNSWVEHWRELSDYIQPRRRRFSQSDRNSGTKRNTNIINGTATFAVRVLTSGMMAGITSPAQTWFRLGTRDPSLGESTRAIRWLFDVEDKIRQTMMRSNVYTALHSMYGDLAVFGTAAMLVEPDDDETVRAYTLPIGQYYLANSDRLKVDTVYREVSMTVSQVVGKFTAEKCSARVKREYDRGNYDSWVDVLHVIEPNRDVKPGVIGPDGKQFSSIWIESGTDAQTGVLGRYGYDFFPVMAPRWGVVGEDVYGCGPGMEALGDVKQLQHFEKRKSQILDKIVNPPMRAPMSMVSQRASLLPGDITYVDAIAQGQTFQPAMEVSPSSIAIVDASIRENEARIKTAFLADLWLMLHSKGDGVMTAREVAERHEEKVLQLGPVLERLGDELLDPLIESVFGILLEKGQIPPPPEELRGADLRVEYLSIVGQAQKTRNTAGVERLTSFVGSLAQMKPEALDKLNADEIVDQYSEMLGTSPSIIRSSNEVAQAREARAIAQQQAQEQEQLAKTAESARTLSQVDTADGNALSQLIGGMSSMGPAGMQ